MRKGRARLLGAVALVLGIAGAVVLWWLADERYDDAVSDLAPAPVGCDTTLVFERTGTYTFFVETVGSVGEIDGDCESDDRAYDLGDGEPPDVDLVLTDEQGDEVDLDQASGPSYDREGAKGSGVSTADIDDAGDYVLTASSEDPDVVIRVGRDPSSGVTAMRVGAIAALLVGVGLFVLAFLLPTRRPPATATGSPASPQWPATARLAPPVAPPYANPPSAPPYGLPPPQAPSRPSGPPGPRHGSGQPLPPPTLP